MFGFVIGAASLAGLIYVLTHRDVGTRRWPRAPRRWLVDRLVAELDATKDQAQTIREAVDTLHDRVRAHRDELGRARTDVAEAMRAELLDEVRLGELFAHHDDVLGALRRDFVEAIGRIHVVLDPKQRQILAGRIEKGFGWRPHHRPSGGPYRSRPLCGQEV